MEVGVDPMSNEELVAMIRQGQNSSEHMGQLYEQNKALIYQWVTPFLAYTEREDLMQEAYFGLDAAVKHFDESKGFAFNTYAKSWVVEYARRFAMNCRSVQTVPRRIQDRMTKYNCFIAQYEKENGSTPTDSLICEHLGINQKDLEDLRIWIFQNECRSLEETLQKTEVDGTSLAEVIGDGVDLEQTTVDDAAKAEANAELWRLVDSLTEGQKNIIKALYQQEKTKVEAAEEFSLSPSRVGQLEIAALRNLKKKRRMQTVAAAYDYDCGIAYHGSIGSFTSRGCSVVEALALKRKQTEKEEREASDLLDQILQMV